MIFHEEVQGQCSQDQRQVESYVVGEQDGGGRRSTTENEVEEDWPGSKTESCWNVQCGNTRRIERVGLDPGSGRRWGGGGRGTAERHELVSVLKVIVA